jgi:hypothetical protein
MVRYTVNSGVQKLKSKTQRTISTISIGIASLGLLVALLPGLASAAAPAPFFNGFETDTSGWFGNITRVASGTNGVTSAAGSWHAEASDDSVFTRWGGYADTFPANGYKTSLDIYLNTNGGYSNDTRFDWDSAVSNSSGGFLRDFIFNCGYYNDTDTTGSGPRFVCSASNNSSPGSAFPKNPGRDPFAVTASGWYTFQHRFYDNGSGVLAVDLSILNSSGTVLHTWTLSNPADVIGSTVGGNRYGWFPDEDFSALAVDNSQLSVSVGPPTSKDQCKKDGWQAFNNPVFKNQGDCVSYVVTDGQH